MIAACALTIVFGACGCVQEEWDRFWDSFKDDRTGQPAAVPAPLPSSKALEGTIGQLVTIDGARMVQVRGFGLVVDLVDAGGRDGPEDVKKYLAKEIRRRAEVGEPGVPAEMVLDTLDSAMVEVTGLIPAAARKGDRFDVVLRALGTQARSLVGGRLVLCDLKPYAETARGLIEGRTVATAAGPVFVSIFDRDGRPSDKFDLRTGMVLGGGVTRESRNVRLVLNDPRYSTAQQIRTRINSLYAKLDPLADAKSPGQVDLTIPDEFRSRKWLFLERVAHTYLNANPALQEKRIAELVEEMQAPDADRNAVGLALEAMGKIALPQVRALYAGDNPEVTYFAGRTGMRLGDSAGAEVVASHAKDRHSPLRGQAIDELGYATMIHAAQDALRRLLDDPDDAVRLAAYKGLRRFPNPPGLSSCVLDEDNLILDVAESSGPYLIYVQRLEQPRIALIGTKMRCRPPAIFPAPGGRVDGRRLHTQISAKAGDTELTVVYTNKRNRKVSDPLKVSLIVADMIRFLGGAARPNDEGQLEGLAVPYSEIVDILYALCKAGSIPAKLVTDEQAPGAAEEMDGRRERPESEY